MTQLDNGSVTAGKGFAGLESLLSDAGQDIEATRPAPADPKPPRVSLQEPVRESNISSPVPRASGGSSVLVYSFAALVLVGVVVLAMSSASKNDATSQSVPVVATSSVNPVAASPVAPVPATLTVAAMKANLRASPQGKAKIVATLNRSATLTILDERDGFVRCRTDSGVEGWVSRNLLITSVDAARLAGLQATEYIKTRNGGQIADTMSAYVERMRPDLLLLRQQVADHAEGAGETTQRIELALKPNEIHVDSAASTWFSLEARALLDKGDEAEAAQSAEAAMFADPLNADSHAAVGYLSIKRHDRVTTSAAAIFLLMLAPASTNTWVVVGTDAAQSDEPSLAAGAFARALELSKAKGVTLRVLKDISDKGQDPRLSAAIDVALTSASAAPPGASTATSAAGSMDARQASTTSGFKAK